MSSTVHSNVDVVLIYPPWPVLDDRAILQNSLPPLGLLSIASYMESLGHSVRVYDVHGEKIDEHELFRRIEADHGDGSVERGVDPGPGGHQEAGQLVLGPGADPDAGRGVAGHDLLDAGIGDDPAILGKKLTYSEASISLQLGAGLVRAGFPAGTKLNVTPVNREGFLSH